MAFGSFLAQSPLLFFLPSDLQTKGGKNLTDLYARQSSSILITLGPLVLFIISFSKSILSLWQGPAICKDEP